MKSFSRRPEAENLLCLQLCTSDSRNNKGLSRTYGKVYLLRALESVSAVSCSMLMAAQQVVWCTFGLSLSFIACSAPHKNTNNKTARLVPRRNSLPPWGVLFFLCSLRVTKSCTHIHRRYCRLAASVAEKANFVKRAIK